MVSSVDLDRTLAHTRFNIPPHQLNIVKHVQRSGGRGVSLFVDYLMWFLLLTLPVQVDGKIRWFARLEDEQAVSLPVASVHLHGVTWCHHSSELSISYSSITTPKTTVAIPLRTGQQQQRWREGRSIADPAVTTDAIAGSVGASNGSGRPRVVWQDPTHSGFDRSQYVEEVQFATAADGTRVPVTIAYRRSSGTSGTTTSPAAVGGSTESPVGGGEVTPGGSDGSRPCLLCGYGFYGLRENVAFDAVKLLLLQLGWVVAVAHVRGGGWRGAGWHEAGRGEKKGVAVGDFLAVAQHLVQVREGGGVAGVGRVDWGKEKGVGQEVLVMHPLGRCI